MERKQCRQKHRNRRYLTDESASIPKQSRKRWQATDGDLYNVSYDIGEFRDSGNNGGTTAGQAGATGSCTNTNNVNDHDLVNIVDVTERYSDIESVSVIEDSLDDNLIVSDENLSHGNLDSFDCDELGLGYFDDGHAFTSSQYEDEEQSNLDRNSPIIFDTIPDIPNGEDPIKDGSDISRGQAIVIIIAFILRHQLTGNAVEDLLEIFDMLAPGCLPQTKFLLTKGISIRGNEYDAHLFCPSCDVYLAKYSLAEKLTNCTTCNKPVNRDNCLKNGDFFLYIPIENQLRELLRNHSLVKKSDFIQNQNLTNILSGKVIQEHFRKGELLDSDITLIWNCDGAPVFHSSKRSIWPLQACVNEISSKSKDNCLLLGLWFSKEKPWSHTFLKPFVQELKHLGSTGMDWKDSNDKHMHSRVFSLCASCDSCARPMFRNTMQFNGKHGCDWCLQEGEVIPRGDGTSRVYPLLQDSPVSRDNKQFQKDALESSESNPINGVKGISPLLFLPLFNIIRGFVPDYLHCILLGVVRSFTGLWFDSCNHNQPWYIGNYSSEVSQKIVTMKIPSCISRLPRSLSERKYWKGSEWKSFLLYYSLIVLEGRLPQKYLHHWFLLVFSTNLLLQDSISSNDVDEAENALKIFVKNVPVLYGKEYCTFNIHQLLHIPNAVRDWGPLWGFSCFRFEGNIGNILNLVRGTKCVPMQICKTFLMSRLLPRLYGKYFSICDIRLESLFDKLMCSGAYVRKKTVSMDGIHFYGSGKLRNLQVAECLAVSRSYGCDPNRAVSFKVYDRFSYNSIYMTSCDYKQSNRHSDDTVQLKNGKYCIILRCIIGKFFCECIIDSCSCENTALLFFNYVDRSPERTKYNVREIGASSNDFMFVGYRSYETHCIELYSIARKCFRHIVNDKYLITALPTTEELDK